MQIKEIIQVFLSLIISTPFIIWWKVWDFFSQKKIIVIPENSLSLQKLYLIVWFYVL
jgi:hypothetical protein